MKIVAGLPLTLALTLAPALVPECGGTPADLDQDGYEAPADCDDQDPMTYPGAPEICEDAIDQDCDGVDPACSTFQILQASRSLQLIGDSSPSEEGPVMSFEDALFFNELGPWGAEISGGTEFLSADAGLFSTLEGEEIRISGVAAARAFEASTTARGFAYADASASLTFTLAAPTRLKIQGYIQATTPTQAGHPVAGVAFTGPSDFDLAHQVVVEDVQSWSTTFDAPAGEYRFSAYSVTDINLYPGDTYVPDGTALFDFLLTPAE